jgi:hypothetical protein
MSEGFITKIDARSTKFGVYHDVYVDNKNLGGGKFPPKGVEVGDYVSYEAVKNDKGYETIKAGSLSKINPPQGIKAPATPAPSTMTMDRQDVISRQAALNSALHFVEILADNEAIPGGKTLTGDKKADKIEAILMNYLQKFYLYNTGTTYEIPEEALEGETSGSWDEQE